MKRRAGDWCPIKAARWQGVLIGWGSFVALALFDAAVRS